MDAISDDEDDIKRFRLDGTEEDGYGRRLTTRLESSRRSTSFELPDPPPADGPSSYYAQGTDPESSASPSKRRRTETAKRDDSSERPETEAALMLKKFREAAKRAVSLSLHCSWLVTDVLFSGGKVVTSWTTFRKRR